MPRARRTQGGDRAQQIASVPGQRYGEGVAQQAMQAALPAPQRREDLGAGVPTTAPTPAPQGPDMQQIAAMLAGSGVPPLTAGTLAPSEPITAGLSTGPGPGPQVLGSLRATTPLGRTLRHLYERSGDPIFARLADRAGL